MALRERLRQKQLDNSSLPPSNIQAAWMKIEPELYQGLKAELHQRLIDKIDLTTLEKLTADQVRSELLTILHGIVAKSNVPLNRNERDHVVQELLDEVTGLGPLEPLLADSSITDILANGAAQVYVERHGQLQLTPVRFRDNDHLRQIINRIVARVGRRVDETSPMVDARLPDG
jgi:pilus assembly protein CpaF